MVHEDRLCGARRHTLWSTKTHSVVHEGALCGARRHTLWCTKAHSVVPHSLPGLGAFAGDLHPLTPSGGGGHLHFSLLEQGLALEHGVTYAYEVLCTDAVGHNATMRSPGVTVDLTPPLCERPRVGDPVASWPAVSDTTDYLAIYWGAEGCVDPETGWPSAPQRHAAPLPLPSCAPLSVCPPPFRQRPLLGSVRDKGTPVTA